MTGSAHTTRPPDDVLGLSDYTRARVPQDWERAGQRYGAVLIDQFNDRLVDQMWPWARASLGHAFHGVRRCPEHRYPLLPGRRPSGACQQDCLEVFIDALRRLFHRLFEASLLDERSPAQAKRKRGGALCRAGLDNAIRDALARYWVCEGLIANPDRAVQQAWVRRLVPDPTTRRLLAQLLWLARTHDDLSGGIPWDRIGSAHGMTPSQAHRLATAAVDLLYDHDPSWVARNLDRPLTQRLAVPVGHAA